MTENEIGTIIVDCAYKIHKNLGPGLLESTYKECLFHELSGTGLLIEKEKPLPLIYRGVKLDCGYRADLVVENKVIVELKAVEALSDIHFAQVLTYMKVSDCKLGYLINFNVCMIKQGIKRIANKL
jgi:GxxExxY protein